MKVSGTALQKALEIANTYTNYISSVDKRFRVAITTFKDSSQVKLLLENGWRQGPFGNLIAPEDWQPDMEKI